MRINLKWWNVVNWPARNALRLAWRAGMKFQGSTVALLAILALSLFLRVVNLQNNLHFTGDEGRDALIAYNIVRGREFPVLGPGSSIGNINLGPLYYYLISPFGLLGESPVNLAIPVIFFSVLTSALLYRVIMEVFKDKRAALIAALFYAIYPTTVAFGRFSWNPNIMPFFSLLYFYSLWKAEKDKNRRWILVAAVSFVVMIQSHYVSLAVLPITAVFLRNKKFLIPTIVLSAAGLCLLFIFFIKPQTHYFEVFWPFAFILVGIIISRLIARKTAMGLLLTAVFGALMLGASFKMVLSNRQPNALGIKKVVDLIEEQSGGGAFNFAVLSPVNREDSYKYFFMLDSASVRFDTPSDQLFVVCENMPECNPHGHPKYEIAIFDVKYNGQVEITEEWNINDFYKVVKLAPKENLNAM